MAKQELDKAFAANTVRAHTCLTHLNAQYLVAPFTQHSVCLQVLGYNLRRVDLVTSTHALERDSHCVRPMV